MVRSSAESQAHRLKNRECMRKARQRQSRELQEMKDQAQQLEKEYAELCQLSTTEMTAAAKRLGAENLLLQNLIKQKVAWERQVQRALDFEAVNASFAGQLQDRTVDSQLDMLDEVQAEQELGFRPLTNWECTQLILDNKRDIHHVEARLLLPSELDELGNARTHRMQAFGWDIMQRVDGGVMEFVFSKKFTGLDALELMRRTWINGMELAQFRKVKAETRRLQVLQQLNPTAAVFVRDVASPSTIATFRSVFARVLVKAAKEFPSSAFGTASECTIGSGFVLATHSVSTDSMNHFSEEELSGKLAWANLTLSIEAYDVADLSTGETCQYVRWAGRTDYCSEEHAHRNAADTLQGMLRWEMLVIAPALNLVSLRLD